MTPTHFFATATFGEQVGMTFALLIGFVVFLKVVDIGARLFWRRFGR